MSRIKRIAIIGAGLMGQGIALTFLRARYPVAVYDPSQEILDAFSNRVADSLRGLGDSETDIQAMLARIRLFDTLQDCVKDADFVTEAVPERLDIKQQVFAQVEAIASDTCILASNTSVIPIGKIMAGLAHRQRALGTHWWNPAHLIPLVEVIRTEDTSEAVMDAVMALLKDIGKTPVRVEKDVPGFIGNRLQHALWREAISLVENGVCDAAAVDTVVKSSFGRRLAVLGPLENADLVGTDLTQDIHRNVLADLERATVPSPYLDGLVGEGKLGMKSGQGFHAWTDAQANAVRGKVVSHLVKLKTLIE